MSDVDDLVHLENALANVRPHEYVNLFGGTVRALLTRLRAAEARVAELEAEREGRARDASTAISVVESQRREIYALEAVADAARVVDGAETHRGNCDAEPCVFCGALTVLSVMVAALDAATKGTP
jgi:hypothetical protein